MHKTQQELLIKAFDAFDAYNAKDPNKELVDGKQRPKELLYALRMTERLDAFAPEASLAVKLAARCQHVGRWEIPRNSFPVGRTGYLKWRTQQKLHHCIIAENILSKIGFDGHIIDRVKSLLMKKSLKQDEETQLLEDVVCLVFIQYYLHEFAHQQTHEKIIGILQKTMKKMSDRALKEAGNIPVDEEVQELIKEAS